jgi:hypothetical protein
MHSKVVLNFTGRLITPVEGGALYIMARPTVYGFRDGLHEAWMEIADNGTLVIEADARFFSSLTAQQISAAQGTLAALQTRGCKLETTSRGIPAELASFFRDEDELAL